MLILSVIALLYTAVGIFTFLKVNDMIQSGRSNPSRIITDDYATGALNILAIISIILLWPYALLLLRMRENMRDFETVDIRERV